MNVVAGWNQLGIHRVDTPVAIITVFNNEMSLPMPAPSATRVTTSGASTHQQLGLSAV